MPIVGQEGGAEAGPAATAGKSGPSRSGPSAQPGGISRSASSTGMAAQLADGACPPAPLLPVDAGAGGDEGVDGGAVGARGGGGRRR